MSKKIILKSLTFKNFKGIKDLTIDFDSKLTNIYGDNGTCKTTVFDGFTWTLFDKDSSDISKFTVQPLDENNNIIHMQETEVTAILEVDGIAIVLKKVLKEKWTKKRGEVQSEFKGTTTSYYVNDVPFKQGEYQKKISEIIPENIFKLLTNPLYFSSVMKWQDRRNIIFELNSDVTIEEVINSNKDLKELSSLLNPNEDMDSFNKRIKSQKGKLVKDKESIPYRVDELNKSIKDNIDFATLESRKIEIISELKNIEAKMLDGSKVNDEVLELQGKRYNLISELQSIKNKATTEANKPLEDLNTKCSNIKFELNSAHNELTYKQKEVQRLTSDIESHKKHREDLKEQWYAKDAEQFVFDEKLGICPMCKRPFEEHDIEAKKQELLENFNKNKAKELEKITKQGQNENVIIAKLEEELKAIDIEVLKTKVQNLITQREKLIKDIQEFKPELNLDNIPEYQVKLKEINELEDKLSQPTEVNSQLEGLKSKKNKLELELQDINRDLAYKSQNKQTLLRISELQEKEKDLAQKIANLEKAEYLAETFIKTKVELLESSINSEFKYVKFKLFDTQVNGGINECCEVLVNGIPYNTNLNNAAKINGGIDIINILSNHYEVYAPIFIDNKESVTKLIDTDSQVINLIVSEKDTKLRISNSEDSEVIEAKSIEDNSYEHMKFSLNKQQFSELRSEGELKFADNEGQNFDLEFVEETEWIDEGKYQYCDYICIDKASKKYFATGISRSGSYFSDYWYNWDDDNSFEFVEVKKTKITTEVWK